MREYSLGEMDEFVDGQGRAFDAGGRTVAVFRSGDKFFALANRCLHKGASMCEGNLTSDGKYVRCPWHNWAFDLQSGRSPANPSERMRTYVVKVEDDEVILLI